jgi:hypothetical protein
MNRVRKHLLPKRRIADRLTRAGFRVVAVSPAQGYDLLVNERVRVALRVAFPRKRRHSVTVRGRKYLYRYRSWHFNFHHHGRLDNRYADVFVCLAMKPKQPGRDTAYVIPWEDVSGKTFSLHAGRRRYAGQYAPHREHWRAITEAVGETKSRLRKVA